MSQDHAIRPETLLAHSGFVRAMATAVLGRDGDVEDAVQDTWMVALTRSPRDPGKVRSWLGGIARRVALGRLRGERRRAARERGISRAESGPSVGEVVAKEEIRRRLLEAVLSLEPAARRTILLRYYDGLSIPEIARREGLTLESVRSRLRRSLERLRERLDQSHPGGRRAWACALLPWAGLPRSAVPPSAAPSAAQAVTIAAATVVLLAVGWAFIGGDADDSGTEAADARSGIAPGTAAIPTPRATLAAGGDGAREETSADEAAAFWASGRVVDEGRRGLSGVAVGVIRNEGWGGWQPLLDPPVETRTDAEGRFHVRAMHRGARVVAQDPVRGLASVGARPGVDVVVVLPSPNATIHGVVRDVRGKPLAGSRILVPLPGADSFAAGMGLCREDGSFRLEVHAAPTLEAFAIADGHLPSRVRVPPLDAERSARIEFALVPSLRLRGKVVHSTTGAPVPGARLVLVNNILDPPAVTDDDGSFEFPTATEDAQERHLDVSARGFRSTWATPEALRDDGILEYAVRLEPLRAIHGVVLDARGGPAAGARVTTTDFESTTSDRAGRFTVGIAPESLGPVAVVVTACRGSEEPGFTTADGSADVTVRLGPETFVECRTVDESGRPVADVRWIVRPTRLASARNATARLLALGSLERHVVSGSDGAFRLDGCPAGTHEAYSEAALGGRQTFDVPRTAGNEEVRLVVANRRRVSGRVVDSDAQPVADAAVWVEDGPEARSDEQGAFSFEIRREDRVLLRATAGGYRPATYEVLAGGPEAIVVLRATTEGAATVAPSTDGVRLDLRLEGDVPPEGFRLHVCVPRTSNGPRHATGNVGAGRLNVSFPNLPPWPFELYVDGGGRWSDAVEVPGAKPGGVIDVAVRLKAGVVTSGRVVGRDGAPATRANVVLQILPEDSLWRERQVAVGPDGRFAFPAMRPGRARLVGRAHALEGSTETDLGADDVVIALQPPGGISGRVEGWDASRARPLSVHVEGGATPVGAGVEADGTFQAPHAGQGVLRLHVEDGSGARGPQRAVVVGLSGRLAGVVLEAPPPGLVVSGAVLDAAHRPLSGIPVTLSMLGSASGDPGERAVGSDADGRFGFEDVSPGSYVVHAQGQFAPSSVVAGTTDLVLVVPRDGRILGTVTLPRGTDPTSVWATAVALRPGIASPSQRVMLGGSFCFRGVAPGDYVIRAGVQGQAGLSGRPVRIAEGATVADVVVDLRPAAALSCAVRDDRGQPVPGALVEILPVGVPAVLASGRTSSEGTLRLTDVPAGRLEVRTVRSGAADASSSMIVDLVGGSEPAIEIRLR